MKYLIKKAGNNCKAKRIVMNFATDYNRNYEQGLRDGYNKIFGANTFEELQQNYLNDLFNVETRTPANPPLPKDNQDQLRDLQKRNQEGCAGKDPNVPDLKNNPELCDPVARDWTALKKNIDIALQKNMEYAKSVGKTWFPIDFNMLDKDGKRMKLSEVLPAPADIRDNNVYIVVLVNQASYDNVNNDPRYINLKSFVNNLKVLFNVNRVTYKIMSFEKYDDYLKDPVHFIIFDKNGNIVYKSAFYSNFGKLELQWMQDKINTIKKSTGGTNPPVGCKDNTKIPDGKVIPPVNPDPAACKDFNSIKSKIGSYFKFGFYEKTANGFVAKNLESYFTQPNKKLYIAKISIVTCGPCKIMSAYINNLKQSNPALMNNVEIVEITDNQKDSVSTLPSLVQGQAGYPTVFAFNCKGEKLDTSSVTSGPELEKFIKANLR